MAITNTTANLDQFETKAVVPLSIYAPGTNFYKMMIRGNSILASVFVKDIPIGAAVDIEFFDTTTGTELTPERFDLASFKTLTSADNGKTFRILVPRIHNKPQIEVNVAGAACEFGIYITVVSDFPQESPYLDGQDASLASDRGNAGVLYDPSDGKFYLARGTGGIQTVEFARPSVQTTRQITLVNSLTEYSHTFPANTKNFQIWINTAATVRYATIAGDTLISGNYVEFEGGGGIKAFETSGTPAIYLYSNKNNTIINLVSWA